MWACFKGKSKRHGKRKPVAFDKRFYTFFTPYSPRPVRKFEVDNFVLQPFSNGGTDSNSISILPDELHREIILRIARDNEAPKTLSLLSCVCKYFYNIVNQPEVLERIKISTHPPLFLAPRSYQEFVYKCSERNYSANFAIHFSSHARAGHAPLEVKDLATLSRYSKKEWVTADDLPICVSTDSS